jgi:hypothetical protein
MVLAVHLALLILVAQSSQEFQPGLLLLLLQVNLALERSKSLKHKLGSLILKSMISDGKEEELASSA